MIANEKSNIFDFVGDDKNNSDWLNLSVSFNLLISILFFSYKCANKIRKCKLEFYLTLKIKHIENAIANSFTLKDILSV